MLDKPEFYEKLRTLLNSGISVKRALEILVSREKGSFKRTLETILAAIDSGETLAASLESSPGLFSPFEVSVVRSGEITGNLEENLGFLSDYLARRKRWKGKIITGLIYPFILFHAAVLLPPLSVLIMEGFAPYARAVRTPFIILYMGLLTFFLLRKFIMKSDSLSLFFERILWRVPVSGKIRRGLALSRFLRTLGVALKSGLNPDRALGLAAGSSGAVIIREAIPEDPEEALKEKGLAGVLESTALLRAHVTDLVYTGEQSGTVDDSLLYAAGALEKEAETLIERLIIILPVLVYLGIALYIAGVIIRFYGGLYGDIISF